MKKYLSTLMAIMMLAILGIGLGSCGSSDDGGGTEPEQPKDNPLLNWKFTYETTQVNDGSVVIKWKAEETTNGIVETGEARVSCNHEHDGYAGPREASLKYSQDHTSHGKQKTETEYAKADKTIYVDSATTTSQVEDGNLIYCYRSQERVARTINGKQYELPYVKVDKPVLEKLEILPGNAKSRTDDKIVVDSICRAPVWKVRCTVENYKETVAFDVQVSDLFKVYQLEDIEIKSGKITGTNRVPITDTEERCDVLVEWTKTDGTTHNSTVSKILNRKITPKGRWEVFVKDWGFVWQNDKSVVVGDAKKVGTDGEWTVYGRTDQFGAVLANSIDPTIETEYGLYHEKAEYKNEQYGMSYTFDFVDFNPNEKATEEIEITSAREGYACRLLTNTIATTYLGYAQDASESAVLYKDKDDEPYYDDWDDVGSYEDNLDDVTIWHAEYLYSDKNGDKRTVFEFIQPRSLEYLGPWVSIEDNEHYKTSAIIVEVESTEDVEQEQDGAVAKWKVVKFIMSATVTLNGSKQYDKWRATEGNTFSITYRGKTLPFERRGYRVNNQTNLVDNGIRNEYHEWGYTDVLEYGWGNNTKYSQGTGTIKIPQPKQTNSFFPPDWGGIKGVKQTVTNNIGHNGYNYAWSIQFGNGVLPVILGSGSTTPDFRFELFEYTDVKNYNSATYIISEDTWINTTAADRPSQMVWERDGKEFENKDYDEAKRQTWDEGHTVNGHPSVYTSRYQLEVVNGYLNATDTYTGTFMGSWN